jgi:DNA modification methylase
MAENFDLFGNEIVKDVLLSDKFLEPPFSVLDTKGGDWQKRKRAWKNLGIESHLGRDVECNAKFDNDVDPVTGLNKYGRKPMEGVSIFDPALCELLYRWFCPEGGTILDPFSGGSVRGIVANYLGFEYTGIDIREEQIVSNVEQAKKVIPESKKQPNYYTGDSNVVLETLTENFDLVFSCPPYADLEVYSDLPGDISNKEYDDFIELYNQIIYKSVQRLKIGGYAIFVVGDIRDKKGYYRDFTSHTKKAFIDAGALLYNEAILLQPLGTAMLRASKIFEAGKKLTKVHENVLIFKRDAVKTVLKTPKPIVIAKEPEPIKEDVAKKEVVKEVVVEKNVENIVFDIEPPKPFVFPTDLDDYKAPDPAPKKPILTMFERKLIEEEMRKKEEESGFGFDMPKNSISGDNTLFS